MQGQDIILTIPPRTGTRTYLELPMVIRLPTQTTCFTVDPPQLINDFTIYQVGNDQQQIEATHMENYFDPDGNRILFSIFTLKNGDQIITCH